MRERLYWIELGGVFFWLPYIASVVLGRHLRNDVWILVILPSAGIISLCAATWIASRREPKWGWVLAGLYILGPITLFGPFCWSRRHYPEEITWRMFSGFLYPAIYSLLIVTPALVAMWIRPKRSMD